MSAARILVLDTETTGLNPKSGHRLTEIAVLELLDLEPSGRHYQQYINPERDVPEEAVALTGLTRTFLKDFPVFHEIIDDFLSFIEDGPSIVIHNATFDMNFLNYEFQRVKYPLLNPTRIIDTLPLARKMFPGSPCNLDALCKRFNINNDDRTKHGALIDTRLLASVYIELMGKKQGKLNLSVVKKQERKTFPYRQFALSAEEDEAHKRFIADNFPKHAWNW